MIIFFLKKCLIILQFQEKCTWSMLLIQNKRETDTGDNFYRKVSVMPIIFCRFAKK